jgi:hypothetical protein
VVFVIEFVVAGGVVGLAPGGGELSGVGVGDVRVAAFGVPGEVYDLFCACSLTDVVLVLDA